MAYGNTCPVCGDTVDNIEYSFAHGMCKSCVIEEEQRAVRQIEVTKIMNAEYEQMELEV